MVCHNRSLAKRTSFRVRAFLVLKLMIYISKVRKCESKSFGLNLSEAGVELQSKGMGWTGSAMETFKSQSER